MSKAPQLVSQHLENISRSALEKYQQIVRHFVQRRPGVYALYRRKKLYYVGLAGDLRWRLNQHLKDRHGKSWDKFSVYLTIGDFHIKELESLLLRVSKPAGNHQLGGFARSENLLRRFSKEVKSLQRAEWYSMIGRTLDLTPKKKRQPSDSGEMVLAEYIDGPMKLRSTYKGKTYNARVRSDGSVRYAGKIYASPSTPATAICKRACNGWWFWKYERAPGDWVRLNELRK
jgi:Restriction Enzyme Adenine Methylase Associated